MHPYSIDSEDTIDKHFLRAIKLIYRIVPKTTPRYIKFCQIKIRTINEVLQYLCSYNANSMAIFSPYIRGCVVIKVILFSGLYGK